LRATIPASDLPAERYLRMPHVEKGMTVGLFGGSFNPPHEAHRLIAETALKRLGLDRLWWMVTPGNPLKRRSEASLARRVEMSLALARHPRIDVTAFEARHAVRYTADTIEIVLARNPGVRFVWVMGADSLAGFHRWQRWREIAMSVPIAVFDRPGASMAAMNAPMARSFERFRLDESDAKLLPFLSPPAWTFIHGPRSAQSSTRLRGG
jgi:nicotinate-nucleotide adenylyltransferase